MYLFSMSENAEFFILIWRVIFLCFWSGATCPIEDVMYAINHLLGRYDVAVTLVFRVILNGAGHGLKQARRRCVILDALEVDGFLGTAPVQIMHNVDELFLSAFGCC